MKKTLSYFLPMALLAACLISCQKPTALSPLPGQTETAEKLESISQETGTLHVSLGTDGKTKTSLQGLDEKAVRCLQVFVFNASNGQLETDKYVAGNSLTLTALVGDKHIWAVVNHERLVNIADESSLKTATTTLGDNYANNQIYLVMAGKEDVNVTKGTEPVAVVVDVVRLTSQIVLSSVKRVFADTYLKDHSFTIKEIYLKNVAGDTPFSLDKDSNNEWSIGAPTVWYNNLTHTTNAGICPLVCEHNLSVACSENTATTLGRVFYTYPNPTVADKTDNSGGARHTRLVIHAELVKGNETIQSYYTFTLPVLKRNCAYEITNITFTMLGKANDNDDSVTETGSASITLNVKNWDTGESLSYNM